jgi:pyruvate dehydrogenase E1 component alpha subunit
MEERKMIKEIIVSPKDYLNVGLSKDKLIWMLKKMMEIRFFEEKVEELYLMKGLITGPAHLYFGEEAVAVGVCSALENGDLIISNHRGHGHALAKGIPIKEVMAELFGKASGTCKGLGGSMHVAISPEKGSLFASAIVGSGIPIAVGVALAFKYEKSDRVVVTFFGDGAVNTGAFHEGVNLAAIWKLPVILVCENNMYAIGMKAEKAVALKNLAERALGYGISGLIVNGNDPVAVWLATKEAIEKARKGEGPTFLECKTYRLKGHGIYDQAKYRPKEEVEAWLKKDPIINFKKNLIELNVLSESDIQALENEIKRELDEAVDFAQKSPILPFEELKNYVYA